MRELLNLNNISILLIFVIIILLIQARYKKNHIHYQIVNNKNIEQFDITTKIKNEKKITDTIKNQLEILKKNNNKDKCIKKNSDNIYELSSYNSNCDTNSEKISGSVDINTMIQFNSDIKNKANNIDKNSLVKKVKDTVQTLRIKKIKDDYIKYNLGNENSVDNNEGINYIKNPLTTASLRVKKNDDNTYNLMVKKYKDQIQNENNCVSFNYDDFKNKHKLDKSQSYYSIVECNDNDKNQKFNINEIKMTKNCYSYPSQNIVNNISLNKCKGVNYIKKYNNDEYIKNYNKNIPDAFNIDNYSIELTPKTFNYITPVGDSLNNVKQCLTIDKTTVIDNNNKDNKDLNNSISFKTCKHLQNQRWNTSNFTPINNSC